MADKRHTEKQRLPEATRESWLDLYGKQRASRRKLSRLIWSSALARDEREKLFRAVMELDSFTLALCDGAVAAFSSVVGDARAERARATASNRRRRWRSIARRLAKEEIRRDSKPKANAIAAAIYARFEDEAGGDAVSFNEVRRHIGAFLARLARCAERKNDA